MDQTDPVPAFPQGNGLSAEEKQVINDASETTHIAAGGALAVAAGAGALGRYPLLVVRVS
jgi:hypothetical protein